MIISVMVLICKQQIIIYDNKDNIDNILPTTATAVCGVQAIKGRVFLVVIVVQVVVYYMQLWIRFVPRMVVMIAARICSAFLTVVHFNFIKFKF